MSKDESKFIEKLSNQIRNLKNELFGLQTSGPTVDAEDVFHIDELQSTIKLQTTEHHSHSPELTHLDSHSKGKKIKLSEEQYLALQNIIKTKDTEIKQLKDETTDIKTKLDNQELYWKQQLNNIRQESQKEIEDWNSKLEQERIGWKNNLESLKTEFEKQKSQLFANLRDKQQLIDNLQKQIDTERQHFQYKWDVERTDLTEQLRAKEEKIMFLESKLMTRETESKTSEQSYEKQIVSLRESQENNLSKVRTQYKNLEINWQKRLDSKDYEILSLRNKISELIIHNEELKQNIFNLSQTEASKWKAAMSSLEHQINVLKEENKDLSEKFSVSQHELSQNSLREQELKNQWKTDTDDLNKQLKDQKIQYDKERQQWKAVLTQFKMEHADKPDHQKLKQVYEELEETLLSKLRAMEEDNHILQEKILTQENLNKELTLKRFELQQLLENMSRQNATKTTSLETQIQELKNQLATVVAEYDTQLQTEKTKIEHEKSVLQNIITQLRVSNEELHNRELKWLANNTHLKENFATESDHQKKIIADQSHQLQEKNEVITEKENIINQLEEKLRQTSQDSDTKIEEVLSLLQKLG